MLRAMTELEKAVDELLGRLQDRPVSPSDGGGSIPAPPGEEECRKREQEASEWIRRALDRLKKL